MILIPCPWCGPRDAGEFHYSGETKPRPDAATAGPEQWRDYLYLRGNRRGWVTERWYHRAGCGQYFLVDRDTATDEARPREEAR